MTRTKRQEEAIGKIEKGPYRVFKDSPGIPDEDGNLIVCFNFGHNGLVDLGKLNRQGVVRIDYDSAVKVDDYAIVKSMAKLRTYCESNQIAVIETIGKDTSRKFREMANGLNAIVERGVIVK